MPVKIKGSPEFAAHLGQKLASSTAGVASSTAGGTTTVTPKSGPVVQHYMPVACEPPVPVDQLCHVSLRGGRTFNLGNYESVKVDVSITVPCTLATLDERFEFCEAWVEAKMGGYQADYEKDHS